ncbi:MAG: hypothetical protein HYZ28_04115 [Myxococcales bacterium]|nr:hypothetical protein [Myxococcales bacterium]
MAFITPAQAVAAGDCSGAVTVQSQTSFGVPSALDGGTSGPLTSDSPTMVLYSDPICQAAIASLAIPAGSNSASFYFSDPTVGSATITYSPAGLTGASQTETIGAQNATQLAFTTLPQVVTAGACSAVVTVQAQDSLGNPATMLASTPLALTGSSGTVGFYDSPGCAGTPVSSVSIVAGSSSASFYFSDTAAGTLSITASTTGLPPVTQSETIQPAPPAQLAFATSPRTVNAGDCSLAVTVQSRDSAGNLSPVVAATPVILSSSAGSTVLFSDSACTAPLTSPQLAAGGSSLSFFFSDTAAGSPLLSASASGLSAASQGQTVLAGPAQSLSLSGLPAAIPAAQAVNLTVSLSDAYGNLATGYVGTVQFTSSDATATLPSAISFGAAQAGVATASVTFAIVGTQTLTAADPASPTLTATASVAVTAGAPAQLMLSGPTSPVQAGSAQALSVEVRDAAGNRVTSYSGAVRFSSSDPSATLPADAAFTAADLGQKTVAGLSFNSPGTHSVSAADVAVPSLAGTLGGLLVLQKQGGSCTLGAECGSGFCSGGVCCDSACTGSCQACNVAGRLGVCGPAADGAPCPNSAYCDGVERCLAGACLAGGPVSCVDPVGEKALQCNEELDSCVEVKNAPPTIARDAVPTAAVGLPYPYNAEGRVRATGERPMTFGACAALAGFSVDSSSGAVSWVPGSTGVFSPCVFAENAFGRDSYTFQVTVGQPSGAGPTATFTASPESGEVPLTVGFDGSASAAVLPATLVGHRFDFGDMTPWAFGASQASEYRLPGGYVASLTVTDSSGRTAEAARLIAVFSRGRAPPSARIVASATRGDDSLTVVLSCDCRPGSAPLVASLWEWGEEKREGATVSHTFGPGRYRVRLTAVDENGLSGTDTVEVVVSRAGLEPPRCRSFVSPAAGAAPLSVAHRAWFSAGSAPVTQHLTVFPDGSVSPQMKVDRAYESPGRYRALLTVTDENGLSCVDAAAAVALAPGGEPPPRIVSVPDGRGECGVPWSYAPRWASTAGPLEWSLLASPGAALPEGMTVQPGTGELRWLPTSGQRGRHEVLLTVAGPTGRDEQWVTVDVECADLLKRRVTCGCGAEGVPLVLLGLVWLAWRPRSARKPPG